MKQLAIIYEDILDMVKFTKSRTRLRLAYERLRRADIMGEKSVAPGLYIPNETRMAGRYLLLTKAYEARETFKTLYCEDSDVQTWLLSKDRTKDDKDDFAAAAFTASWSAAKWENIRHFIELLEPAFLALKLADSASDSMPWL